MAHLDIQSGRFEDAMRTLAGRDSRKVGHNTRLSVRLTRDGSPEAIAVRYHSTDIIVTRRDGWIVLQSGGWHTSTTSARLNALLPGRWGIGSAGPSGRRAWHLWYQAAPILRFVDGLALNPVTGAIGIVADSPYSSPYSGRIETLMSAEDVAAVIAETERKAAVRAENRAARLLREHSEVRHVFDPVPAPAGHWARRAIGGTSYAEVDVCRECGKEAMADVLAHYRTADTDTSYGKVIRLPDIPDAALAQWGPAGPHRQGYNGRARDCGRCHAEEAAARALNVAALGRLHDAGEHVEDIVKVEWPTDPVTGRLDYSKPATRTVTGTREACPWACPRRKGY